MLQSFVIGVLLFCLDLYEPVLNFIKSQWIIASGILFILLYIYVALTNNDILLGEDFIEVKRRLFPFQRSHKFKIKEISEIQMQHDKSDSIGENISSKFSKYIVVHWVVNFFRFEDYKWIKITFNGQSHTYYCFGLEYDYYDNPRPHFEDLYIELAKLNLNVNWTENTDFYFRDLTKRKEEIQNTQV